MGKESFKILTLNNISLRGLERLPRERYEVASEIGHPDAIMLRSADMQVSVTTDGCPIYKPVISDATAASR
jgi:hypothetical protein